jgi:hypothetical protein
MLPQKRRSRLLRLLKFQLKERKPLKSKRRQLLNNRQLQPRKIQMISWHKCKKQLLLMRNRLHRRNQGKGQKEERTLTTSRRRELRTFSNDFCAKR